MFISIARFEMRYQLRNPAFWVAVVLFFLLTFATVTIDGAHIGGGGNVHVNSPVAVMQTQIVMSIFFMFVTAGFVANVVVRDDESGFGGIVRATRVDKVSYMLGRFAGAYVGAAIAFLAVPTAIWLGSLAPWLDPQTLGASRIADFAVPYFVLALPNLFFTAALFFAVACWTRSVTYSYVGVIVFLFLYILLINLAAVRPDLAGVLGYVDPFGGRAIDNAVRYATTAEANMRAVPVNAVLIANRWLWLAIALAVGGTAVWRFRFAERGAADGRTARQERRDRRLAAEQPVIIDRLPGRGPARAVGQGLWARTRFELGLVFRSPSFFILLLVGMGNTVATLIVLGRIYGVPAWPRTFAVIENIQAGLSVLPLIVAIYYAGEVVWRDRERRINEIVDATSVPSWVLMVPKILAVAGVLVVLVVVSTAIEAIVYQLAAGVMAIDPGQWFRWFLAPLSAHLMLIAVLAVFIQALSPGKFVGWAIMLIYLVATISVAGLGFDHPLYIYASTGPVLLSEMNGAVGEATAWWLTLYWSGVAVVLAVLAHLLWPRGTAVRLSTRWRGIAGRLRGGAGLVMAAALIVTAATGAYLFYQMNVLNSYRSSRDKERYLADYERRYLRFAALAQPALTDVRLDVALYPGARSMTVRGTYRFVNDTANPIDTLHVRMLDYGDTRLGDVSVAGARLTSDDRTAQYRIYRFDRPLSPGAAGSMTFQTSRQQGGLRATGDDTRLVRNGTFLNNNEFAPVIGMNRMGLLQGRALRRKYGLPPELRVAKLEDVSARRRNYFGADWVRSDITISTDADQVPLAPGELVSDVTKSGRRTAHYVARVSIIAFFSIQSARYAVRSADGGGGVRLSVYYDPLHAVNVDRMLRAMRVSLDHYRGSYGPYPFGHARIVEFPGYATYAQAFAGTIAYSEKIGFIMDVRDPQRIDFVTYVTAHELAHQYWAHQLAPADMQGDTFLTETLAQYSALMVMKRLYGDEQIRRFLKFELDEYLKGRRAEGTAELPLERVENQDYIHYRKGALVMYLLQDRLGEARVDAVLARLLDRHRFKGAPYASSTELVAGLLALARNAEERDFIADQLQRITLYDFQARQAVVRRLPDGSYETSLTIGAGKLHADGAGNEQRAPLRDAVEVGLFTARPGVADFARRNVVFLRRQGLRSGEQTVRIVTSARPSYAGVDPYNKYVDRSPDDNLVAVTDAAPGR